MAERNFYHTAFDDHYKKEIFRHIPLMDIMLILTYRTRKPVSGIMLYSEASKIMNYNKFYFKKEL